MLRHGMQTVSNAVISRPEGHQGFAYLMGWMGADVLEHVLE
jgi:hypothetical protein